VSAGLRLYRIAAETRDYAATDLSGGGAAASPGRWNAKGERVVYSSPSIAMCVLETTAHVDPVGLPLNRFIIAIDVDAKAWEARQELDPSTLDPAWSAIPGGRASIELGSRWYRDAKSLFLRVPSVIVPEERNVLINATHPLASTLSAQVLRPFAYQTVFRPPA
jgi:RES domain-containing protein